MKIGVDEAPSRGSTASLCAQRPSLTARRTSIASHTTTGVAAMANIELLDRAGVPPSRSSGCMPTMSAKRHSRHARESRRLGGVRRRRRRQHQPSCRARAAMKTQGLLGRVLVSHDAGWYHVGAGGGEFGPYTTPLNGVTPALVDAGVTQGEIQEHPRRESAARVDRRITVTLSSRAARSERPADRPR